MRSIWSGSLNFGLINIPVHVYSAARESTIPFDFLHKADLSPIRFARICKEEEKEIPFKDIVKGYEYQKGKYVVVSQEDFEKVSVQKTGMIEIVNFVKEEKIDTIYFEKPYFLEPDKNASKPYALLRKTLETSKKVGVVKFIFKNKEHLGVIKPYQNAIILNQLRFANEIRELEGIKIPEETISKKEIEMALKLVEQLTGEFHVEDYEDTYTEELKEIIAKKVKGVPMHPKGKESKMAKSSKVQDIMSLLEASLEKPSKEFKKKRTRGSHGSS